MKYNEKNDTGNEKKEIKFDSDSQRTIKEKSQSLNTKSKEEYKVIKKLGEGTYAVVYLAQRKSDGVFVAVKKIKLEGDSILDIGSLREISALRALSHPNIISLHEIKIFKDGIRIIMEYAALDLESLIKNKNLIFMPGDIKSWMKMLLRAVCFCHENRILHRDIKPSNILIKNNGELKLADFGLARLFPEEYWRPMTSRVFTRWYQAPEILYGAKNYTSAVDIWAVGCTFAELMLRVPYLPGSSDIDQIHLINRTLGSPDPMEWDERVDLPNYLELKKKFPKCDIQSHFTAAPSEAIDLLKGMLKWNPKDRLNARDALKHSYFITEPVATPLETLSLMIKNIKQMDRSI